ncbi:MAG: YbaK/EbsC family protein [Bacteroidales bacterium]|nr:YbaK/EbsC family protein [Bacteroidales bacterium]
MPVKKLKEFLDQNQIEYVTINHSRAFTSQRIASYAHIPGKELAKTVMIKIEGQMAMAVLPASYHVNFNSLREIMDTSNVSLCIESEFKDKFPDCEVGAMPPFGNLYQMDVYVAESLTEDEEIYFNAGTHTELIRMSYADYKKLVKPKVIRFSVKG